MRHLAFAALLTAACGPSQAPMPELVEPVDAPVQVDPSDDRGEILSDVQHLLAEAITSHGAGERTAAERKWNAAHLLWAAHLEPAVRAKDPLRALELGYQLGQLGEALRRGESRAMAASRKLDRALEDVRPWVMGTALTEEANPGG